MESEELTGGFILKSRKVQPRLEYWWERPIEKKEKRVDPERFYKAMVRSERKKLKALKRAGVLG